MLYIGKDDITRLVSFGELMDTIELAFKTYEEKNFQMPDRIHLHRGEDTFLYMPCFTKSMLGTKILTVFPENTGNNIPAIQGLMLLNDVDTGKPIALIDGARLTALRTGAVGGVGVRHTTKDDCETVGLVGAGVQGFYQLLFSANARDIKKIYIYDIFKDKLGSFKEELAKSLPAVEINIVGDIHDLVDKSDIVITTTTSNKPVLPNDKELLKGKHYIGIGSYKPTMREFPEALFRLLNEIHIDTDFAIHETGDLVVPIKEGWIDKDQVKTFGKLLRNHKCKKREGTTLFKSVGMALFDLIVSEYLYNKAVKEGIGQQIST